MVLLLVGSLALLGYVYLGYPPLLAWLVRLRGARPIEKADITPPLSLVISAYNEAAVLRRKLENAVALTYPRDQIEIVVISDASDDGTDDIVREFASQGVRLARQTERRGKTAGLNRTVPALVGEIVVFSDANAIYEQDALLKLARNFADREVGCVTGEARYVAGGGGAADLGERVYWDYEIHIKRLETALGSMVGGDGAIYAIRRSLWQELPEDAINDFLNPLQIVAAGWRSVYEPEAVCWEETAGGVRSEYRRRVRIVSRSWRAVFQASGVLNPFRVGLFTWSLISHKVLRWISALFVLFAAIAAIDALGFQLEARPLATTAALLAVTVLLGATSTGYRIAAMAGYFAVINAASLVGVLKGSAGRVSGVWATARQHDRATPAVVGKLLPIGRILQAAALLLVIAAAVTAPMASLETAATVVFAGSTGVLAYVYVGYPVLLALLRRVNARPVRRAAIRPRVCVFIAANDEATVIEDKLDNTLRVDYPADRLEIVLASDGSIDGTNEIARRFTPRVRLLEFSPRRGKMATINAGMKHVTSDIVVFSDANTLLDVHAIDALVQNFADERVGAVSGDVALIGERAAFGRSEDLYYRYERWVQRAESEVGSMVGADGALYAIRRSLFVPPPDDTILDDMVIPMSVVRGGRRVVYEPEAHAVEPGSDTAREELSRKIRVIAGAVQFMCRDSSAIPISAGQVIFSLVSHKALRWLSPLFVAGALTSSIALAQTAWWYSAALAIQTALIAVGLAGCSRTLRRINAVAIAHYFCLVQAAAAVGLIRGLTGRQSVLWRRFDRISARGGLARASTAAPSSVAYTHE
jgi:cellulose synthase/poly-beta-1,6-N-acetylglucosamine synthase-like glycosyltransferase